MKAPSRSSIRTWLPFGTILALVVVVAMSAIAIAQLRATSRFATTLTEVWMPEIDLLGSIDKTLAKYQQLVLRHTETSDLSRLRKSTTA